MAAELYFVVRYLGELERIQCVDAAEVTIGRWPRSALCLTDPAVSRDHAVLSCTAVKCSLRDLGSHNGTRLNGQPITTADLSLPALVEIGPYELSVFSDLRSAEEDAQGVVESTRNQYVPAKTAHDRRLREELLTPAQRRVYDEFLRGHTEKEAAHALNVSINTVHTHSRAIYTKFGVSSRGELLSLSRFQQEKD